MSEVLDTLIVKLNATGLQKRDQQLYDFLRNLLKGTSEVDKKVSALVSSSSSSSSSSSVTNVNLQILDLLGSDSGDGEIGPPGSPGTQGIQGIQGPAGTTAQIVFIEDSISESDSLIPGPIGPQGAPGSTGSSGIVTTIVFSEDGISESDSLIPGPQGNTGTQGLQGLQGVPLIDTEFPEDPLVIPGIQGTQGLQGIQGIPLIDVEFPEDPLHIPGLAGINGTNGQQGPPGFDGEQPDDPLIIPGPQGTAGINGTVGKDGQTIFLEPDIYDDPSLIPGPQGLQGSAITGDLVLVESQTANNVASLDFKQWYSADYDDYIVELINIIPVTNANNLAMRMSTNGGSSYDSGANYEYHSLRFNTFGSAVDTQTVQNQLFIDAVATDLLSNDANWGLHGFYRLVNPAGGKYTRFIGIVNSLSSAFGGLVDSGTYSGIYQITTAVNAFQIFFNTGNISSGTIRVYGLKKVSAASGTFTKFTQDLGVSRSSGTFDITSGLSNLIAEKIVTVVQTADAIASKGNARDEFEMDNIQLTGYVVNSTTIRVYWQAPSIVVGTYAFAYQVNG